MQLLSAIILAHEIKTEDNNDTYGNMEDENNSHGEFSQKESDIFSKKRPRMTEDESTIEVLEQKSMYTPMYCTVNIVFITFRQIS